MSLLSTPVGSAPYLDSCVIVLFRSRSIWPFYNFKLLIIYLIIHGASVAAWDAIKKNRVALHYPRRPKRKRGGPLVRAQNRPHFQVMILYDWICDTVSLSCIQLKEMRNGATPDTIEIKWTWKETACSSSPSNFYLT